MSAIFFGFFAGIIVFSAIAVAFEKNLIFASFYLLVTFLGIAALYIMLEADFIAVTQILIYVGGILILLLFGVLITRKREKRYLISGVANQKKSLFAVVMLGLLMSYAIWKEKAVFSTQHIVMEPAHTLGKGLMSNYLIPFELAGILLLVIIVGVLALSSSIKSE